MDRKPQGLYTSSQQLLGWKNRALRAIQVSLGKWCMLSGGLKDYGPLETWQISLITLLTETEPFCACTDADGWLLPRGWSPEVSWVLFNCLSTLVQVVCKHPHLLRIGWFPLVGESESILCWCCLIHKLCCMACLACVCNRTVTLYYYNYRKPSISLVSYSAKEKKKKNMIFTGRIREAKYTTYYFMFQRPSPKNMLLKET